MFVIEALNEAEVVARKAFGERGAAIAWARRELSSEASEVTSARLLSVPEEGDPRRAVEAAASGQAVLLDLLTKRANADQIAKHEQAKAKAFLAKLGLHIS